MRQAQLSVMDFYIICFSLFPERTSNSARHCQGIMHTHKKQKLIITTANGMRYFGFSPIPQQWPIVWGFPHILATAEDSLGLILYSSNGRKYFAFPFMSQKWLKTVQIFPHIIGTVHIVGFSLVALAPSTFLTEEVMRKIIWLGIDPCTSVSV